jgi:hypothetical protein
MFVLLGFVASIDRSHYQTCEQSSFCRRLRSIDAQGWSLNRRRIATKSNVFRGSIVDSKGGKTHALRISFLLNGAARIRLEPDSKESFIRYDAASGRLSSTRRSLAPCDPFRWRKTKRT